MPNQKKRMQAKSVQTKSVQTEIVQPFDEWEEKMVDKRAQSLIGKFGYADKEQDWWDIKQELLLAILEKRESFPKDSDPKRVVKRIIDDQASWMIKKRKSAHEQVHAPKALSLSTTVDESFEGQTSTYADIVEEDQAFERAGGWTIRQQAELRESIESVLELLTPRQKKVFLSLARTGSVKDTAIELGVTQQAIIRVKKRMAKAFIREGVLKKD